MTRDELITNCYRHLGGARGCDETNDHEHYAQHMQLLLDLLIEELVGDPPTARTTPSKTFNPEQILEEIASSIKHRTISNAHRWYIIYYHDRLTCVPSSVDIPRQIILHEFTEQMVNLGFTVAYWNQLKQNVIKLYKEIKK